jgi:hypothetical protein
MGHFATMIWRNRKNGSKEELDEPRDEADSKYPDAGNSRAALSSVGEHVDTVLEAAERAAADIRRDAEHWAQRHMEDTCRRADELAAQRVHELSSVTDDLLTRARAVARQSDDLIDALDAAGRRALSAPLRKESDDPSSGTNRDSDGSTNGGDRIDPVSDANGRGPGPSGAVSRGARLLATQMAISGSSRERIATRLKEEFGVEDPTAILDEAGL